MKLPTTKTLVGIAGALGMGIGCSGLYIHTNIQKSFKQTIFVSESLNKLRSHEAAKYLLGSPIKDHNIQFEDTINNYYDDHKAVYKIPVRGPDGHGYYFIRAEPRGEGGEWVGVRMELELENTKHLSEEKFKDKRLVIFDSDRNCRMATISLNLYLSKVSNVWNAGEGEMLAELLSFRDPHVANPRLHVPDPEAAVEKVLDPPLDEMVAAHIRGCWAWNEGDMLEAYKCQSMVVSSFAKLLGSQKDENWLLPVMYVVCLDLRLSAIQADKQKREAGKGKPGETLEKASEGIMACFRVCAADARASEDVTKRWGMLNLVNQLFKIYFQVNKLHLCKPLIRAVESSALKERFSKSQLVTYRFYVGRKHMFDNNLRDAEEYLKYAFEHCHRDSQKNKRQILIYLIPVKMLLGQMPKLSLLKKYDLVHFHGVMEAVKEGNVIALNKSLDDSEAVFIKWGIFLILEKLKILTYRNLFKKVTLLMNTHQISIDSFTTALKMMEVEDIDNDETACILANLIFQGRIKGYISYQHNKLVVSKQNAFPPLSAAS